VRRRWSSLYSIPNDIFALIIRRLTRRSAAGNIPQRGFVERASSNYLHRPNGIGRIKLEPIAVVCQKRLAAEPVLTPEIKKTAPRGAVFRIANTGRQA
jgi:hypothetical protein